MKKKIIFILCLAVIVALSFYFLSRKKQNAVVTETAVNPSAATVYKSLTPTSIFFTDMEDPESSLWSGKKNSEKSLSGKYSNKLSGSTEFGITFFKKVDDIPNYKGTKQIKVSFSVYSDAPLQHAAIAYAVTGTSIDTNYEYRVAGINGNVHQWTKQEMVFDAHADQWESDWQVKIYPWNSAGETFFIDDIRIEFYSEEERQFGTHLVSKLNFLYDYETPDSSKHGDEITDDQAHTGKYSLLLSGFGSSAPILKRFGEVATDNIDFISTSFWVYPKNNNPSLEIIASIESANGQTAAIDSKETKNMILKKNEWYKVNFRADFREIKAKPDDVIRMVIKNKGFGSVYIDDFEIIYGDLPLPTGTQPGIVVDMTGNIIMRPGKNKPPFKTELFSECEENALNLIGGIKNGGTLEPGSKMLAGNFLGSHDDELLMVRNNNWSLFKWCPSENNLVRILNADNGPESDGRLLLKGYFSDLSSEEAILIDTTKQLEAQLIRFRSNGDVCGSDPVQPVLEKTSVKFNSTNLQTDSTNLYSGNFTGNNQSEILSISRKTSAWTLFEYKNGNFVVTGSGSLQEGKFISGLQFNNGSSHDKLIVFTERNREMDYCLVDFSASNNKAAVTTFKDKSFLQHFGYDAEIFSGQFEKTPGNQLFYFNNDWRLDIKKINIDENGINVESQMDFFRNDTLNPKHFEYIKIIPGKFFQGENELLIVARNCKDKAYNGRNCNEFEKAEGLPPGFMFYRYQPAK